MVIVLPQQGSFELFIACMNLIIGPELRKKTLIDLCSNNAPITQALPFFEKVFVDILHHDYPGFIQADVLGDHHVLQSHYDVSTCLDGIEHLHKPEGARLLDRMIKISDKQILFTPLGEYMVDPTSTIPESHKCGYVPDDLPGWAHLSFPKWHEKCLNIGAFFFWKCDNIADDFSRVADNINVLK